MNKRLFFAAEVTCPWPTLNASGRILDEKARHLTLAFLGQVECEPLLERLKNFPTPTFKVGFVAQFDQPLFLPKKNPRVVSWHVNWLEDPTEFLLFQQNLMQWLGLKETRDFLPHLTVARSPFKISDWKKEFVPLPLMITNIHLFESHQGSKYTSLWCLPILAPFEEISHTADIAYTINAQSLKCIFNHAKVALCFTFPPLLSFLTTAREYQTLDQIVRHLNEIVSKADGEIGCPFKAISYSGTLQEKEGILQWEMIIDV